MLRLRAILPAVRQEDTNVALQGNQLVISGERKAPRCQTASTSRR